VYKAYNIILVIFQVFSWVIVTGLITYIKVSVASVFRMEGGRALFWCGAVQQCGSAVGALLSFFVINYADIFTAYYPCV
jgi:riboflavin transporter 2